MDVEGVALGLDVALLLAREHLSPVEKRIEVRRFMGALRDARDEIGEERAARALGRDWPHSAPMDGFRRALELATSSTTGK